MWAISVESKILNNLEVYAKPNIAKKTSPHPIVSFANLNTVGTKNIFFS